MKKSSKHSANNELWLISYADLMTLLFGFFFLLYVSEEQGLEKVSQAIKEEYVPKIEQQRMPDSISESLEEEFKEEITNLTKQLKEQTERAVKAENALPKKPEEKLDKMQNKNPSTSGEIMKARLFLNPCRLCIEWSNSSDSPFGSNFNPMLSSIYLKHVVTGGPADVAGLQELDVITHFNGRVMTFAYVNEVLSTVEPNSTINIKVLRDGKALSFDVQLDRFADPSIELNLKDAPEEEILPGVYGRKLNDAVRIKQYIPRDVDGWIVTKGHGNISAGTIVVSVKKKADGQKIVKTYELRGFNWIYYRE